MCTYYAYYLFLWGLECSNEPRFWATLLISCPQNGYGFAIELNWFLIWNRWSVRSHTGASNGGGEEWPPFPTNLFVPVKVWLTISFLILYYTFTGPVVVWNALELLIFSKFLFASLATPAPHPPKKQKLRPWPHADGLRSTVTIILQMGFVISVAVSRQKKRNPFLVHTWDHGRYQI